MAHSCYLLPDCFGPRLRFTFYNQVLTTSQRAARHTASSFHASLGVSWDENWSQAEPWSQTAFISLKATVGLNSCLIFQYLFAAHHAAPVLYPGADAWCGLQKQNGLAQTSIDKVRIPCWVSLSREVDPDHGSLVCTRWRGGPVKECRRGGWGGTYLEDRQATVSVPLPVPFSLPGNWLPCVFSPGQSPWRTGNDYIRLGSLWWSKASINHSRHPSWTYHALVNASSPLWA